MQCNWINPQGRLIASLAVPVVGAKQGWISNSLIPPLRIKRNLSSFSWSEASSMECEVGMRNREGEELAVNPPHIHRVSDQAPDFFETAMTWIEPLGPL